MNDREKRNRARATLDAIVSTLTTLAERDPDQEVLEAGVLAVDAAIAEARQWMDGEDPVPHSLADLVSPDDADREEPLRAAELVVIVSVFRGRLGPMEKTPARAMSY